MISPQSDNVIIRGAAMRRPSTLLFVATAVAVAIIPAAGTAFTNGPLAEVPLPCGKGNNGPARVK